MFPSINKILESESLSRTELVGPTFKSIEYKLENIVEKIKNIDALDENEIKYIIQRQHSMILDYDLFLGSDETRAQAQILFSNKRFLKLFLDIIGTIYLSEHEITCINKLAYDYYIISNKDPEVSSLLLQISNIINNITSIKLSGIMGINGARILSMIANSSFKDERKVHRVNTFLLKSNLALSIQDIVNIYCILFNRFTNLFIYSMLEVKPAGMTDDQLKKFDMISLALLAILDSIPSEDIKKVLYDYAFTLKLVKGDIKVRFSIKSAKSYTRIIKIVNEIESDQIDILVIP